MHKAIFRYLMSIMILTMLCAQASAEVRRDGGSSGQASKKAQYMIRQLHNEKQELQAKLATIQAEHDQLVRDHEKLKASFEKESASNDQLMNRVQGNIEKYNELANRYREAVSVLRKANLDNQYMVKAVREREEWIDECTRRNEAFFTTNTELLDKYAQVASEGAEVFTGLRIVEVENEMQDYEFKLEDLLVAKFKPTVEPANHIRNDVVDTDVVSEAEAEAEKNKVN